MLNLYDELLVLLGALNDAGAEYALCGGLAMAVHGNVRATIDIDLLVPHDHMEKAQQVCRSAGFTLDANPMMMGGGHVPITRLTKVDSSGSVLSSDILEVTDATRESWDTRIEARFSGVRLPVVSREGLIAMKRLRGSAQDLADIERLEESE